MSQPAMISLACQGCGAAFQAYPSEIRRRRRYCSMPCRNRAKVGRKIDRGRWQDRLWSYIAKSEPDDCWPWTGGRDEGGYGVFNISRKQIDAHRATYLAIHGEIPDRLHVLHSCDNPPCCNPRHLWAGTNADNVADKMQKGRHRSLQGDDHPRAKISTDDVRAIRASDKSAAAIAREYGISWSQAKRIRRGDAWKHVA